MLGPFLSLEDPDTFFFMRGFPDLASRERMKAEFYKGELWKDELENVLMPMLEKYDVVWCKTLTGSFSGSAIRKGEPQIQLIGMSALSESQGHPMPCAGASIVSNCPVRAR